MNLFRPDVQRIAGYMPGEQPQATGWTKLNTNENPYPPSPMVIEAIQAAASRGLNVYPDPLATRFREAAAALFDVGPDWILPANGSDENLTILMRSFVDPGELVAYPYPSYILYETLADLQGANHERIPLNTDWSWNPDRTREIVDRAKLVFVPNPNSPSANRWPNSELARLVPPEGVLVLDEAYEDFCDQPHRAGILQSDDGDRIVITRTLSKSYSLAGVRFGFAIAHPDFIAGMRRVKDSYNCNTLSIAAAIAAIEDQEWMLRNTRRIRATRTRLVEQMRVLGFHVVDSQANFVWATHSDGGHEGIYAALKQKRILVRYLKFPDADSGGKPLDGLRVTIGTDDEIDRFLACLSKLV